MTLGLLFLAVVDEVLFFVFFHRGRTLDACRSDFERAPLTKFVAFARNEHVTAGPKMHIRHSVGSGQRGALSTLALSINNSILRHNAASISGITRAGHRRPSTPSDRRHISVLTNDSGI